MQIEIVKIENGFILKENNCTKHFNTFDEVIIEVADKFNESIIIEKN